MAHYKRLIALFMVIITVLSFQVMAQDDADFSVYRIIESDDAYDIVRTDARTNNSEIITIISRPPTFNLASIMPAEEQAAAQELFAYAPFLTSQLSGGVPEYFELTGFRTIVRDFSPSPDGEKIAFAITYQACVRNLQYECFGVSQLEVFDIATGDTQTIWSLPIQAYSPYYPSCDYSSNDTEAYVREIRWTPDQQAIIAQLSYGLQFIDMPLVVIPLTPPDTPFTLGNGGRDWAVNADGYSIVSISSMCNSREKDLLNQFDFDLAGSVNSQSIALESPIWLAGIPNYNLSTGVGFFQGNIIFAIETDSGAWGSGDTQRLAVVPADEPLSQPTLIDVPLPGFELIRSSPSTNTAIIEDRDGMLWRLQSDFMMTQMTSTPVEEWQFADDDTLIVKFAESTTFEIISLPTR